jgi:hypothetical protein
MRARASAVTTGSASGPFHASIALFAALAGCNVSASGSSSDAGLGFAAIDAGAEVPEPRPGMAWIPPGVLIAGTPPDRLPRVADEEMAGEQVVMRGFFVDLYPYPNEVGAIPTTNLSLADAKRACEEQSKRLCTELELERACKGPDNTTYEYGDQYKAPACTTGSLRSLVPNGVNASCVSGFGVHDLHGGIWSWTSSAWKRDASKPGLTSVRGGNGQQGELIGRCANGRGLKPEARREDTGVRCCAGDANEFEVVLNVVRGEPLKWLPADPKLAPKLEALVPDAIKEATSGKRAEDAFKIERVWLWHPLGNEELVVGGGCAHTGAERTKSGEDKSCGVVIARVHFETPSLLAFISSDWWQPTLAEAETPRELFLNGGDRNGAFRRRVAYAWGKLTIADKERKRKHKGEKEPRYD